MEESAFRQPRAPDLPARVKATLRRMRARVRGMPRFRGAFPSHAAALAAACPDGLAGYDHAPVAEVQYAEMCRLELWDYPVLFWLERLLPGHRTLLDAGGHMGTKFRAFGGHLRLPPDFDWAIYDLPAIIRAGRERAALDQVSGLSFHDRLEDTPPTDVLLASGLLQFLDIPFPELLRRLPKLPRHIVLNKVATRAGPGVFTLERFPTGEVPYQVRNLEAFLGSVAALGYQVEDAWEIPQLSHVAEAFGVSTSRGYCMRLRG